MRFQSVLDSLFVFLALFMICLSQRDDADRIIRIFPEYYEGNTILYHPNSNPSLLAVILARVGTNKKNVTEHLFRLGEVEPMLPDVGPVLGLVPFKSTCNSKCSYTQGASADVVNPNEYRASVYFSVTDVTNGAQSGRIVPFRERMTTANRRLLPLNDSRAQRVFPLVTLED